MFLEVTTNVRKLVVGVKPSYYAQHLKHQHRHAQTVP